MSVLAPALVRENAPAMTVPIVLLPVAVVVIVAFWERFNWVPPLIVVVPSSNVMPPTLLIEPETVTVWAPVPPVPAEKLTTVFATVAKLAHVLMPESPAAVVVQRLLPAALIQVPEPVVLVSAVLPFVSQ